MVPGKSGNISCKINDNGIEKVLITPSGISLKNVDTEEVMVMDRNGKQLEGRGKPSSETPMHLSIYQKREDINSVVHTHSPYATGFSFSDEKIRRMEGFGAIKSPYIPVVEYVPPGTVNLANLASEALKNEDALILKNHGLVAIGTDLNEAILLAEFVEYTAKTEFLARVISHEPIPTHLKRSK
jgi:L-fuculose-phosphate aldolase